MRIKFITGLILLLPFLGFSQGEFNKWYFPEQAGLDFNTNPPSPLVNSGMNFGGNATASISDSLGNLLFYSEGELVYNRNHQMMPNGDLMLFGIWGVNYSQPVFAVRQIGIDPLYYLFCYNDTNYTQSGLPIPGLFYSVIDMSLNGGLGDVVSGMKNIPVLQGQELSDKMHGTRHYNNKDVWLVTRNRIAHQYVSYLINSSGISSTPVFSQSLIRDTSYAQRNGSMKISQDGKKLAAGYYNRVKNFAPNAAAEFCKFNYKTGVVTPLFCFRPIVGIDTLRPYDVEFSRDSRFLYIIAAKIIGLSTQYALFQYDATLSDSLSFMQSEVFLGYTTGSGVHGLQLAPDGKIYGTQPWIDSLSAINYPNVQGIACGFQKNALGLNGQISLQGLPQFLQRYKAYIHSSGQCQGQPVTFSGDIWPPADTTHWNFGDPASGGSNVSYLASPAHLYSSPGTYTVELYVRHNDNRTDTSWRTVMVYPSPAPSLGPDRTICTGSTTTLNAGFCLGCVNEWKDVATGLVVGTNQTFTTGIAGNYCVKVTNGNSCSGYDTVQVITTAVPQVTNTPLYDTICSGQSTNISLTSNVAGTNFHWTATLTSGNITGFSADSGLIINQVLTNTLPTAGIVTYHITAKVGSCLGNTVDFPVTLVPEDSVKITISTSANNICAGTQVAFTATPTNPGALPLYQWKVNGINAGGNSTSYSYTPSNGDDVTCVLLSSNTVCISNNPATSNSITMVVNPLQPVGISIASSQNPVCTGTSVTFTATPVNEGTLPSYQWKVNGINAGGNSANYTFVPLNGDIVSCVLTSNATCPTGNPATSNPVTMTVNPNLVVSVSITPSSNPFCLGESVTFTATPGNAGVSPQYQWKVNGTNVGISSPTYPYNPANGDQVSCVLNSNIPCPVSNPVTSNTITMIQNNSLLAGVTIAASQNPFCPGSSVTFTGTPSNGGPSPSFQWKVNGINAGTNSSTYSYNPIDGDSVRCIMSSNLACVTNNPVSSIRIIMSGTLSPFVTFTSCFDTVTTVNAKPIKLKGGIPLNGIYSGPGVSAGIFNPAVAGAGTKTIVYTYTNVYLCSASKTRTITVQASAPFTCGNTFIDIRDGRTYPSVQIGTQCWMAANLNRGVQTSSSQVQFDNCIDEKYCFGNDAAKCSKYGGLYQWDEMMRYDDVPEGQGLCPPGWHIPTDNDWTVLCNFYNGYGFAGKPLQDTIISGFRALPGGIFYLNSSWSFTDFAVLFWTSSSWGNYKALSHGMNTINFSVSLYPSSRANAFPVRCLRD